MDIINIVIDCISGVGFPIVCTGALFWYIITKDREYLKLFNGIRESLDKNTQVLTALYEQKGGGADG